MSNYISQIINCKIDFLKSSYEANKEVGHQGVKGNLNATLLNELIRDIIPEKYRFANGIVQDSKGFQSNESDLVIYDNEILPSIMFGGSLGFIPAESVKYVFEVKSTLNATELSTTVSKFTNLLQCDGYVGVSALFAFTSDLKSKTELERYFEKDTAACLHRPSIRVLMVADKGYYFFSSKKVFLKDLISKSEFAKISNSNNKVNFEANGASIEVPPDANILVKGDLVINGLNYDELHLYIHRWYGIETIASDNVSFLSFLSGISNTLSLEQFGKYLLADNQRDMRIYSECVEDMWGNISYTNQNFMGYEETNLQKLRYSVSLNQAGKGNKIEIFPQ